MIPIHPQACAGQPDQLRWIIPTGLLPFSGIPAAVPAPMAALLDDGTLEQVRVEPDAVVTVFGAGRDRVRAGARVRSALHAALDEPTRWVPAGNPQRADDEALRVAAAALLDGPVGQFAQSHGGRIELVGAQDGIVTVQLAGACHGCPAARHTLRKRLEDQLRRRHSGLRAVVEAGGPAA
ncbi:NifU family protein [Actinoplanes sp. NPDC004185]